MSDYISINVQETEPAQSIHHSARTKTVTYLVANPHTITNYRHDLTSLNTNPNEIENIKDYFNARKDEISQDYKQHIKQTMKSNTKLYQEAVISFGRERFEQNNQADILKATEDFCLEFEQKYNVKILMTSLHLDEGHKDENGTIQHNYHTHLLIENYSFDTHKTGMRKVDFRTLQTELAQSFEHLGFERGDPEKKAQRLEHREYRAMKEQETKREIELVDTKTQLAKLEVEYKQARQELKDSGIAKQADYQELKRKYEEQRVQIETKNKEISIIQHELEKSNTQLKNHQNNMLFDKVLYDRILETLKKEHKYTYKTLSRDFELSANYLTDICSRVEDKEFQKILGEALQLPQKECEEYLATTRLNLLQTKEEKSFLKSIFTKKTDDLKEQVEELREVVVKLSSENKELRAKVPTDTPPAPEVEKILEDWKKKSFSWDLKKDYQEVRDELKATGVARQQDYSTAKNIYLEKQENEIATKNNICESYRERIDRLEEKLKAQIIQSPTPTNKKPIEHEETISMEELKPLERVIGAFASVGELVERLIEKITNLTKTTENLKLELKELHEENEDLKEELKEYKDNEIEFER